MHNIPEAKRPNVVLICTDQLRFDALGCTGNRIARTPNIDRIAERGISLNNHLTPCQICAPSRASLFSGLYPRHHGLVRNGLSLDPSLELFSHVMMDNGMRTHGVGKFHFQPILAPVSYGMPESNAFWELAQSEGWRGPFFGFESVDFVIGESFASVRGGHYARWLRRNHPDVAELYLPENRLDSDPDEMDEIWRSAVPAELHYNAWIGDRSIDFINRCSTDESFSLFVSFPDPHHPFSPPAPYCDNFDPSEMPKPNHRVGELDDMPDYIGNETWLNEHDGKVSYREFLDNGKFSIEQGTWQKTDAFSEASVGKIIAYTHAMVQMIDDNVGRILDALEASGRDQDTIVIFTSDHGELLGDHGLIRKGPMPYRQLLQIPFLCCGPGIPSGETSDALTSHLDVKETLLELLGLPCDSTDGTSLASLLRGEVDQVRDHTFAEYHPRTVPNQYNQTIVGADSRLTVYPLANEDKWGEFFEHTEDPGEHQNLFSDPGKRQSIDRLKQVLAREFPPLPNVQGRVLGFY